MQERAVTVDGITHELGDGFMVIATQNPIEQEGTYPLPEAQLDRFLFKVVVGYPTRDEERDDRAPPRPPHHDAAPRATSTIQPVADLATLVAMRARGRADPRRPTGSSTTSSTSCARRASGRRIAFGASPRAATMLTTACRALRRAARPRLRAPRRREEARGARRCATASSSRPGAEIEGLTAETVVRQILEQVPGASLSPHASHAALPRRVPRRHPGLAGRGARSTRGCGPCGSRTSARRCC